MNGFAAFMTKPTEESGRLQIPSLAPFLYWDFAGPEVFHQFCISTERVIGQGTIGKILDPVIAKDVRKRFEEEFQLRGWWPDGN